MNREQWIVKNITKDKKFVLNDFLVLGEFFPGRSVDILGIYDRETVLQSKTFLNMISSGYISVIKIIDGVSVAVNQSNPKADLTDAYISDVPDADSFIILGLSIKSSTAITTGVKARKTIQSNETISSISVRCDMNTNMVIDIKKSTLATFPTFTSICGGNAATLTGVSSFNNTILTGWNKSLSAGDILEIVVTSNSAATDIYLQLNK